MSNAEQQSNLEQKELVLTPQQKERKEQAEAQQDIVNSTKELSEKIPDKTQIINQVAPKMLQALATSEEMNMKTIRDKVRVLDAPDDVYWELNLLEQLLAQTPIDMLQKFDTFLAPWTKFYNSAVSKLVNQIQIFEKTSKNRENNEANEKSIEQIISDTQKSQSDAISKNGLKVKSAESLDASLTTPDQQIAFATEQLGYDQAQATEIVNNYNNSQYSEAGLSIGQLLSFLQTEQALWNNGIDSDPFLADVAKIRDDLQIPTPKTKKTEPDI